MELRHLHAHQMFSMLDGYGTPAQVADRIIELGHDSCAITDHGNCYGHVPWQKAALKKGIKPIFGCEFYYADNVEDRTKFVKSLGVEGFPHITVLARTQKGYENFLQLVGEATSRGFYYKPRIDREMLFRYQEGLTVLTGCPTGMPTRLISQGQQSDARRFIKNLRDNCEDVAVEIVAQPGYEPAERAGSVLIDIADELGMRYVMTADCHFPSKEDYRAQNLMVHISLKVPLGEHMGINLPEYQYYCSAEELAVRAKQMSDTGFERFGSRQIKQEEIERAINASKDIADSCNVEIMQGKSVSFYGLNNKQPNDMLREWMERGFNERTIQGTLIIDRIAEYRAQAEREFTVITDKGFADYLLSITDVCRWVKEQNSPVMCRGSAGGSVLLWLLGASETDPVLHDLSFERFYDENRPDPPDVDVDFETPMRPRVVEYIYEKYGADHCAQLLALSLMRAKVAVVDTAAAYKLPRSEYDALAMALDSKNDDLEEQMDELELVGDPEIQKVMEKHPELRIAAKLVGQVRQSTVHACGVIVSAEPLYKCVATLQRPGEAAVCSIDKHAAASLGLLKFDLLAVRGYDVVADAMRIIGRPMEDLYKLKFDDAKVFDLARSGKVVGVFQLDGAAMQIGHQIGLDTFEELFAASALCRPGASQFVPLYRENKFNRQKFDAYMANMDPRAAAIVRPTYGVVLYQEQMMAFARILASFSWVDVHKLRKRVAASSFHGYELGPEYSVPFMEGCAANGIQEKEAEHWWRAIKEHGVYSFNKSHCVTYAIVSYWMLWIKTYYPDAYYEAYLASEGSQDTPSMMLMKRLVQEFRERGGKVQLVSRSRPTLTFTSPEPGLLIGGWGNLKGIGDGTAARIVANGPYNSWKEVATQVPKHIYGKMFETGITGEMRPNNGKRLAIAPWFPSGDTTCDIVKTMEPYRLSVAMPGQLARHNESVNGVSVAGYIATRHKKPRTGSFKGDQTIYTLEDETGMLVARVSTKKKELQMKVNNAFAVGDYVVLKGWWTGDGTLFISDFVMIKKVDAL